MNTPTVRGIFSLVFLLPVLASADYVAYSVDESNRSPLPQNIDDIDAKYLVNLAWGDYGGKRARVGVLQVDNTSSATSFRVSSAGGDVEYSEGGGVPVNAIEAIVIDAMSNSGRFRLVERTVLSDVLGEQDLAASGRVAQPSAAQTGKVLGAQYLVQMVITDYETGTSGSDAGGGGGLFRRVPVVGGLRVKKKESRVGMNIRLIDAETSEIIFTKQIESLIKESAIGFAGLGMAGDAVLGGFLSNYSKTPVGQAVIAGVHKGVYELIKEIGAAPAEGSIIKADATQIFVNLGEGSVEQGERLRVASLGEELIDPDTGISLGGIETSLGEIEIAQVQEKFSVARPVSLSGTPSRGDKVVSTRPPEPLEFADSWREPGKK